MSTIYICYYEYYFLCYLENLNKIKSIYLKCDYNFLILSWELFESLHQFSYLIEYLFLLNKCTTSPLSWFIWQYYIYIYIYATSYSLFLGTEKIVLHINVPVSFLHLVSDRFTCRCFHVSVFSRWPRHTEHHIRPLTPWREIKKQLVPKKTHLGAPEHLQTRLSSGGRRRDGAPEEEEEEEMESQNLSEKIRHPGRLSSVTVEPVEGGGSGHVFTPANRTQVNVPPPFLFQPHGNHIKPFSVLLN